MRVAYQAAVLIWLAFAPPAFASAGIACDIDDAKVKLHIEAAFTRGLGGGMVNFGGELKVLVPGTPADLRALKLERAAVSQVWYRGRDIKLQLYHERDGEPFASVDLLIETKASPKDESSYRGTYELTINYMTAAKDGDSKELKARGKVVCSGE